MDSREINASFEATVAGLKLGEGETDNALTVKLGVRVNKDDTRCFLGDEFKRIAFSSLKIEHGADGIAVPTWDVKSTELGWALEPHVVRVFGNKLVARPRIDKFKTIKGEAAVTALVSFDIDAIDERRDLLGKLIQKWKSKIDVKMELEQLQLKMPGEKTGKKTASKKN